MDDVVVLLAICCSFGFCPLQRARFSSTSSMIWRFLSDFKTRFFITLLGSFVYCLFVGWWKCSILTHLDSTDTKVAHFESSGRVAEWKSGQLEEAIQCAHLT